MSHHHISRSSLVIPLRNSAEDEIIEIDFADLPEGEEVLQILKQEKAALHYWLDLALAYYKAKQVGDFVQILEQSGEDASLDYAEHDKDQMRALDMLAAYYVQQGNKERNKEKRKERFAKATILFTTADKLIMYDTNHLLGRAYFCLLEGNKIDQADAQFSFVLKGQTDSGGPPNIPALMGKALIAFKRKEYKLALGYFKKCLRYNPNCPADVRVGIGYCLAHMGYAEKARFAFERALELDAGNIPAIVALAVLDINSMDPGGIAAGIQGLSVAYQQEPENPMVLNHLSNHFFYKSDLEKTETLAWHAFHYTDNEQMRAESCYQIARCYHKRGDYDRAFQFYYQAAQFSHPKFVLPHFGLGQIYISREEYENAISSFERVLKVAPNNYETLSVLGSLYAFVEQQRRGEGGGAKGGLHSHHRHHKASSSTSQKGASTESASGDLRGKAREMLKRVAEMNSADIEVLIELAQLQEQGDPQSSLDAYLRVCDLLRSNAGVEPPAEILNNIGALYFARKQYDQSRHYFQLAKQALAEAEVANASGGEQSSEELTAMSITITYNLGRANESLCLYDEAERIYSELHQRHPSYIDSVIRLGCIHRDRGDAHRAMTHFKEAISIDANNPDPWTHLANMHLANGELGPAQKKYEQILKSEGHDGDTYCWVALGNIWLQALYNSVSKERDALNRQHAEDNYRKALKLRPKNIWAANGIGCVLALRGEIDDARDVFSQVREATAELPDVWINIAHIYMEKKQYVQAVQMYHNCRSAFHLHNDVALLMYIARAYWRAEKYAEARDFVERAIAEAPTNLLLKFNHAVVLMKAALRVLQAEKVSGREVEGAVRDLKTAECTFEAISKTPDGEIRRYPNVSRTLCRNEQRVCNDLLAQTHIHFQRAKAQDEEERRRCEQLERERLELLRVKEEKERTEREERQRERDALVLSRQKFVEKKKEILKKPIEAPEKKAPAGGRAPASSRKRKAASDNDDFLNDSSDLGEYLEKERTRERPAKRSGGREARRSRRSRRELEYDEEREEGSSDGEGGVHYRTKTAEEKELDALPQRMRKKVKSKAFVSSSEESSSEGAPSEAGSPHSSSQRPQQAMESASSGDEPTGGAGRRHSPSVSAANSSGKRKTKKVVVESEEESGAEEGSGDEAAHEGAPATPPDNQESD